MDMMRREQKWIQFWVGIELSLYFLKEKKLFFVLSHGMPFEYEMWVLFVMGFDLCATKPSRMCI